MEKMFKLGIDCIDEFLYLFENKCVGLIINLIGVNFKLELIVDILNCKVNLMIFFGFEYGICGDVEVGVKVESYFDKKLNIEVYLFYG